MFDFICVNVIIENILFILIF